MVKWNEYTWYSKLAAAIFFLAVFPAWTFYIGMQYEKTRFASEQNIVVQIHRVKSPVKDLPQATTTPEKGI